MIRVERNVAVHLIEVEETIVIQIAELPSKGPSTQFDAHRIGHIVEFQIAAGRGGRRHPEIVALHQHAFFRYVRNENTVPALIEDIADGGRHSALRRVSYSSL